MKPSDIPVVADPDVPPGVVRLRSGGEQVAKVFITEAIARGASALIQERKERDPAFAEECASLMESFRFVIRYDAETAQITCECCGTLVVNVLECAVGSDRWQRAIWESETGRKHTLRRCNWKRGQALAERENGE